MSHSLTPDMQKLLDEATNHLKNRRWANASTIFEMIIQADPNCLAAQAGIIMAKYHLPTIDALPECKQKMTNEEQVILTDAFADIGEDISPLMNRYRGTFFDESSKNSYKKTKQKTKRLHFVPVKPDLAPCYIKSFPKIQDCQQQFESISKYKDSKQCAELCALTHEMISNALQFIPSKNFLAVKLALLKLLRLPSLLYILLSWIPVFYYFKLQVFTAPLQTLKQYFVGIFTSARLSSPSPLFTVSFYASIVLSVMLGLFLFGRVLLNYLENGLDGFDGEGFFYLMGAIGIIILHFVFIFLAPFISIILFILICLRNRKSRRLIKTFTVCNADLIQRMEVLSKQCSMLNPHKILRELF